MPIQHIAEQQDSPWEQIARGKRLLRRKTITGAFLWRVRREGRDTHALEADACAGSPVGTDRAALSFEQLWLEYDRPDRERARDTSPPWQAARECPDHSWRARHCTGAAAATDSAHTRAGPAAL